MESGLHEHYATIEREHWWFQGRRQVVASVLRSSLPPVPHGRTRRLFDVGCGTGEMTDMLREFGAVSGIDASPEALAHCRSRLGDQADVAVGTIPDDLPPRGSVDVISAFDVIEHLDDDLGALRAIAGALEPGATLVVTVPAFELLWGPHDVAHHHRRRYTRAPLRRRLETSGFEVVRISYFNTWLFPVVAAVRTLRRSRPHPDETASDLQMPSPLVNRLLLRLFSSEAGVLRSHSLPVGVSLIAVCRRAAEPANRVPEGGRVQSGRQPDLSHACSRSPRTG